jgi:pimeloyl-ACP methyl ester carboxylesterase
VTPPILFLHGVFGKPVLLRPWMRFFEEAGFTCYAPVLPGREPTDRGVLSRSGLRESFARVMAAREECAEPPIVIGHSMGGLLGQKLAAATDCAALVLLASIPPGVLWPQLRPLPHLFPVLPAVLAGRAFLPSARTMRHVPLSTLPRAEQDALVPELVPDSGRVFRSMTFGTPVTRVKAADVRCPVLVVSAGSDRNVAPWLSRRLAARYGAEHQVHPALPHWIIAESALPEVAPPVLAWLRSTQDGWGRPRRPPDG